jgi:hypothetical protein
MIEPNAEIDREAAEKRLIANLTMVDLKTAMKQSVAEGFEEAMTVEAAERFWAVGISMLQAHTKNKAGDMVLSGIGKMARIGFWSGLGLLGVYMIGGWPLVVKVWKAIF